MQVHNIGEEKSVGFFNHEISICSKRSVDSASRKMVLNMSHNIIGCSRSFRTFSRPGNQIKVVKGKWNYGMADLQTKGYTEKEVLNLRLEAQKLKDIEFLKGPKFPRPFTNIVEGQSFMDQKEELKNVL